MYNFKKIATYSILLPLLLINFSCEETTTESTIHNGDVVGSWMLTGLTGIYTYVIDLPGAESGVTWPADTSFGVKLRWESASLLTGAETSTDQWISEFKVDSVALYEPAIYNLAIMTAAQFGLIGVFEDASSAGGDATYKMKGTYPGIFYNYSICSSAGSTAPMTDQGLYTWNQTATTNNFVIKRDPSIAGSQVLPPFDDGTLTVTDTTLNIKFVDRDSHSELYENIMTTWDEGKHPHASYGGNGTSSGGDRTYMAFPDSLAINAAGVFVGLYDGTAGTTKSSSGYIYDATSLAPWNGFYTWVAYSYGAENTRLKSGVISVPDADGDGVISDPDVINYMLQNPTNTSITGLTYNAIINPSTTATTGFAFVDDSGTDYKPLEGDTDGGKMTFNVISDCAAPVDVTIDFDATFTKCTTDNCAGDNYHVIPTW